MEGLVNMQEGANWMVMAWVSTSESLPGKTQPAGWRLWNIKRENLKLYF